MTTLGIVDLSDYNSTAPPATGLVMATHKATEGTSIHHKQLAPRLNAYRAAGVPILGSYHVLRTPGSGGAGSLAQQLEYWVAYLDAQVPWWRTWPHWVMQADCEKWPYDPVSGPLHLAGNLPSRMHADLLAARTSNTVAFADLMVNSGLPGWKVTYASKGQYGNNLTGIATSLWNASYGSNSGSYPGDNFSGWGAYSGQTPALLQYTSNPYDKNAFRGSRDELLAMVGDDMAASADQILARVNDVFTLLENTVLGSDKIPGSTSKNQVPGWVTQMQSYGPALAALATAVKTQPPVTLTDAQVDAFAQKVAGQLVASNANGLTSADHDAIVADVKTALRAGTGS